MPYADNEFDEAIPIIRQALLSTLVVVSFAGYTLYERLVNPVDVAATQATATTASNAASPTADLPADADRSTAAQNPGGSSPSTVTPARPSNAPSGSRPNVQPTPSPTKAPAGSAAYKDGQYTGSVVDAFFGNVQVKAVIQNGRLANVQFVDYPHDRRTSERINNIAMPMLMSEAIQSQRARVNIISGATLTSDAFMRSLQAALDKARG